MGALLGICLGLGILLIVAALTGAPAHRSKRSALSALRVAKAAGSALAAALLAFLFTGLPIAAVLAAGVGAVLPTALAKRRAEVDRRERERAWPDVIDSLVSAVRAGMSLPEAVCAIANRGPDVLRPAFARFAADYRSTGKFDDCLLRLRAALNDPVADRITEAMLTARDVGGTDLGRMLRTLADFVRQDLRLRGEAEARRSWTTNGARLAVAAPWLVLVLLSTRPGTVEAYQTVAGMIILIFSAATSGFAYWLMTQLGQLPAQERLVR